MVARAVLVERPVPTVDAAELRLVPAARVERPALAPLDLEPASAREEASAAALPALPAVGVRVAVREPLQSLLGQAERVEDARLIQSDHPS